MNTIIVHPSRRRASAFEKAMREIADSILRPPWTSELQPWWIIRGSTQLDVLEEEEFDESGEIIEPEFDGASDVFPYHDDVNDQLLSWLARRRAMEISEDGRDRCQSRTKDNHKYIECWCRRNFDPDDDDEFELAPSDWDEDKDKGDNVPVDTSLEDIAEYIFIDIDNSADSPTLSGSSSEESFTLIDYDESDAARNSPYSTDDEWSDTEESDPYWSRESFGSSGVERILSLYQLLDTPPSIPLPPPPPPAQLSKLRSAHQYDFHHAKDLTRRALHKIMKIIKKPKVVCKNNKGDQGKVSGGAY